MPLEYKSQEVEGQADQLKWPDFVDSQMQHLKWCFFVKITFGGLSILMFLGLCPHTMYKVVKEKDPYPWQQGQKKERDFFAYFLSFVLLL
jgi:hypothetical protein